MALIEALHAPEPTVTAGRTARDEGRGPWGVLRFFRDSLWRRPVLEALLHGRFDRFDRWMRWGASPNLRFMWGEYPHVTLLGYALQANRPKVVNVLLDWGADPNLPTGWRAETPLCQAVRLNRFGCAQALVAAGARWDGMGRNDDGQWVTAAWWVRSGHVDRQEFEALMAESLAHTRHNAMDSALPPAPPSARRRF